MTSDMFFSGWENIARNAVLGVLGYIALIFLLRVSGKRTLSQMSAFDFVVTIALGSTFATLLLDQSVSLAEGVTAFLTLIGLQYVATWLAVRSKIFERAIKSQPTLLCYEGQMLRDAMKAQRISEEEIFAALRENGLASLEETKAVILESQGELSVVKRRKNEENRSFSALRPTAGYPGVS
jgi:uncharacterized membrane protein YcaP (DUF421 family)